MPGRWSVGLGAWVLLSGLACGPSSKSGKAESTGTEVGTRREAMLLLAHVEQVLLAHRIRAGDSLAVRLEGTVGSDGSWALDGIDVRHEGGVVVVVPRVRRVPGDFFIQMVVPLASTVRLALPEGSHSVVVRGASGDWVERVEVRRELRPSAPQVAVEFAAASAETPWRRARIVARVEDGWIETLEVQLSDTDERMTPLAPDSMTRAGNELVATCAVPASGPPGRALVVRAVDGQGNASPQLRESIAP